MKPVLQLVAIAVVLVVIIFSGKLYLSSSKSEIPDKIISLIVLTPCHLTESSCLFVAGKHQLEMSFSGDVGTMKTFKLLAKLDNFNLPVKKVQVDFSMQSMKMGFNHFRLLKVKKTEPSRYWQASILLPVCVSRRTDWLMKFSIKTENRIYRAIIPLQIK